MNDDTQKGPKPVDEFMDDLSSRAARHHREEQVAYVTVTQLGEVKAKVDRIEGSVTGLKSTIEGSVDGIVRKPGLIDVVGDATRKLDTLGRIGLGIAVALGVNIIIDILKGLGVFK